MGILFENYVTFIDGGTSDGVGFFVGNFFITAGHVFNEGQTHSTYFGGQRIVLDKSEGLIALSFLQKICLLSVKN